MAGPTSGISFGNANELRPYPLAVAASGTDTSGSFTLPETFLVGISLAVPYSLAVDPSKFYLQGFASFGSGYVITVGYDDGTGSPPAVATATLVAAAHVEGNAYNLTGLGDFADVGGLVGVGLLADVAALPAGAFTFSPAAGALDPDCVRPEIRALGSLAVINGLDQSARMYGDVQLIAGSNIRLSAGTAPGGGAATIRIDAVAGADLAEACTCTGAATLNPPITAINGVPPDSSGNFTLAGNACLTITAAGAGLQLADTCSQPCCGCPELEALTAEVQHLGDEALTLQNYSANLKAQVDAMGVVVLGSRLADTPCS